MDTLHQTHPAINMTGQVILDLLDDSTEQVALRLHKIGFVELMEQMFATYSRLPQEFYQQENLQ